MSVEIPQQGNLGAAVGASGEPTARVAVRR